MYWLLLYDLVDDYLERRVPLRDEHLGLARAAHDRGALVFGGALEGEPRSAVLLFQGDGGEAEAEAFADADPYVREGVVTSWRVRQWNVVVGGTS